MKVHQLSQQDVDNIRTFLQPIAARSDGESTSVSATELGTRLPDNLKKAMDCFQRAETDSSMLLTGFPVNDERLEPTPPDWGSPARSDERRICELLMLAVCSLLGVPTPRKSQQASRLLHDILPIRSHEGRQINSSSTTTLTWHTEDASQPDFADYLVLLCLRNPQGVATDIASVQDLALDAGSLQVLFDSEFLMRDDLASATPARSAATRASVLFGDRDAPYVRLDSYFIDAQSAGLRAGEALRELLDHFDAVRRQHVLLPGQMLVIDNLRTVHGRGRFHATHDGNDRWLKRANVRGRVSRRSIAS